MRKDNRCPTTDPIKKQNRPCGYKARRRERGYYIRKKSVTFELTVGFAVIPQIPGQASPCVIGLPPDPDQISDRIII